MTAPHTLGYRRGIRASFCIVFRRTSFQTIGRLIVCHDRLSVVRNTKKSLLERGRLERFKPLYIVACPEPAGQQLLLRPRSSEIVTL